MSSELNVGDLVKNHLGFILIIIEIDELNYRGDHVLYWCWPISKER
jgi:hypothetical protein